LLVCLPGWATWSAAAAELDLPALCERVKPAFVFIGGGSGVIISPDGLMLSNNHVVARGQQFDVRTGGGRHYRAALVGRDVRGDLALLQLPLAKGETVPCLKIGDSEALRLGDDALAVGNPLAMGLVDQAPTFTFGIISGRNQVNGTYTDALVTDAALNPGNSGGPLVNAAGELVGINGQIASRWGLRSNTGLGYAISSRQIGIWLPRLKEAKGGEVAHGQLPGLLFDVEQAEKSQRVVVKGVGEGTHAAGCGFREGDRIVRFEGAAVLSLVQLAGLIGIYPEGHEVQIGVERDGRETPLHVKLVKLRSGSIGVKLAQPDKDEGYVRVGEVQPGSPAEKAGLKKDDEIVSVKGVELSMSAKLQYLVLDRWLKVGVFADDLIVLRIRRQEPGGKPPAMHEIRVVPK
ncbi:MAG: trypsin-like peptidase domain-containing protein, partial [Thermoguttaceae bacterium]|jgi:serine protease Do